MKGYCIFSQIDEARNEELIIANVNDNMKSFYFSGFGGRNLR